MFMPQFDRKDKKPKRRKDKIREVDV